MNRLAGPLAGRDLPARNPISNPFLLAPVIRMYDDN